MSYTVSAATDAAVIASISTPVGPVVAASARIRSTPAARSGVIATTRSVSGSGWHSGISSAVCLPPMTPASSATVSTSPFAPPPSITRLIVSAETATSASATARRAVGGLALTSTMRGPAAAVHVGEAAAFGARGLVGIHGPSCTDDATRAAHPRSAAPRAGGD